MPRILVLSNIPTPYQMDFLGELSTQCELKAVFLWSREANRDWTLEAPAWLSILEHQDARSSKQKLAALLNTFKPEVLIVGGYRLPLANWLKRYALLHRARYFYWLEKPLPASGMRAIIRTILWCITLPFASGVLGIGSEAVAAYRPYARRSFNLPYSIRADKYTQRPSVQATRPLRFLYVGQFIHRKGIAELLDAFSTLSATDAQLSLAGSGELKPLVDAAMAKHSHIKTLGFMEPSALAAEFSKHDVFILPSRHDGWAVVVAEAMAAGLPVISTRDTGAFVDLVQHQDCGCICDVTAGSIRAAIQHYIAQPGEVLRQGMHARNVMDESRAEARRASHELLAMLQANAHEVPHASTD